ncbi:large ribosomal subunit protein mL40-like [Lineus longissimus]|uniref:large ribosomal subunit protein mL40-like n=1 Tax=Lineus longissimus TaxID=88925 RepID=UPI002B4DA4AF
MQQAILQIRRLTLSLTTQVNLQARHLHTQNGPLAFRTSAVLGGEPMKKRKKQDPMIAIQREKKKERKLEKAIKRLEKFGRKLKPIEEIAGDTKLRKEANIRRRDGPVLTFEEAEERALVEKDWCRYKVQMYRDQCWTIAKTQAAQERALDELRKESEELYQKAIQIDSKLIPFKKSGPVDTPPIKDYDCPDGDYTDTTKTY